MADEKVAEPENTEPLAPSAENDASFDEAFKLEANKVIEKQKDEAEEREALVNPDAEVKPKRGRPAKVKEEEPSVEKAEQKEPEKKETEKPKRTLREEIEAEGGELLNFVKERIDKPEKSENLPEKKEEPVKAAPAATPPVANESKQTVSVGEVWAQVPGYSKEIRNLLDDVYPDMNPIFKEIDGKIAKAASGAADEVGIWAAKEFIQQKQIIEEQKKVIGDLRQNIADSMFWIKLTPAFQLTVSKEFSAWIKDQPETVKSFYESGDPKHAAKLLELYNVERTKENVRSLDDTRAARAQKKRDAMGEAIIPRASNISGAVNDGDFDANWEDIVRQKGYK